MNGGRREGAAAASVAVQLIDLRGRVEAAAWDEGEGREQKWAETESMMMPPGLSLSAESRCVLAGRLQIGQRNMYEP